MVGLPRLDRAGPPVGTCLLTSDWIAARNDGGTAKDKSWLGVMRSGGSDKRDKQKWWAFPDLIGPAFRWGPACWYLIGLQQEMTAAPQGIKLSWELSEVVGLMRGINRNGGPSQT